MFSHLLPYAGWQFYAGVEEQHFKHISMQRGSFDWFLKYQLSQVMNILSMCDALCSEVTQVNLVAYLFIKLSDLH